MFSDLNEMINGYFNFNQKLILVNVIKLIRKQKVKKSIPVYNIQKYYYESCEKLNVEPLSRNDIIRNLKIIEIAGLIKRTRDNVKTVGLEVYTIENLEEVIYQDPELIHFRNYPAN